LGVETATTVEAAVAMVAAADDPIDTIDGCTDILFGSIEKMAPEDGKVRKYLQQLPPILIAINTIFLICESIYNSCRRF
jgi:uncharacterized protein (UPF0262 family)